MISRNLLGGPAIAEVVERQGFSRHPLWTLQWVRVTVVGEIGGPKNHEPIEHRQNLRLASGHVAVPQLQVTAEILAPILVQVEQQIEAPVETVTRMLVEVGMDGQLSSRHDLVQPAAVEARIGYEIVDPRYAAEKFEEGDGVQVIEEEAGGRTERRLGG